MKKQKIVVIVGPTAVGKTAISIELAKKFDAEIVSADSIQIYKDLNIGSAKVRENEKQGVVHHLIDIVSPKASYSAGDYSKDAKKAISQIAKRGKLPIVVGGTGMYVSSLLFEMGVSCGKDEKYRAELEEIYKEKGSAFLHQMLEQIDPDSASKIHPNHQTRIIRALEIYHLTGKKKSEQVSSKDSNYDYLLIGLTAPRDTLYERINQRVDKMLEEGLIEEVRGLISQGVSDKDQCMQGIGYKQTYEYLCSNMPEEEYIEKLKQASRNYAKRQMTYFKKMPNIVWKTYEEKDEIFQMVQDFLK